MLRLIDPLISHRKWWYTMASPLGRGGGMFVVVPRTRDDRLSDGGPDVTNACIDVEVELNSIAVIGDSGSHSDDCDFHKRN